MKTKHDHNPADKPRDDDNLEKLIEDLSGDDRRFSSKVGAAIAWRLTKILDRDHPMWRQKKNEHHETPFSLIELMRSRVTKEQRRYEHLPTDITAYSWLALADRFENAYDRALESESWDRATLTDWFINSVVGRTGAEWTEEQIEELLKDFYVIKRRW